MTATPSLMIKTFHVAVAISLACCAFAQAKDHRHSKASEHKPAEVTQHPDAYDALIAEQAKRHGLPESLIHRVIVRESRYIPTALNRIYYGLMQITYATARSMGYKGEPSGLLDAKTNLTYAVPYLANAYIVANKNPDRAVALYAAGYYFEARRQHKLDLMRTASSEPIVPPPPAVAAAPEPPANPVSQLFSALTTPLRPVPPPIPAEPPPASDAASAAAPSTAAQDAHKTGKPSQATTEIAKSNIESTAKTVVASAKPVQIVRRSSARQPANVTKIAKSKTPSATQPAVPTETAAVTPAK